MGISAARAEERQGRQADRTQSARESRSLEGESDRRKQDARTASWWNWTDAYYVRKPDQDNRQVFKLTKKLCEHEITPDEVKELLDRREDRR